MTVHYGQEVTGLAQDEDGVEVELAGGALRARYLVGCDGGRSAVRKAAGIEFPGWKATTSSLIAEVEMAEEPEYGIRHSEVGISGLNRVAEDAPPLGRPRPAPRRRARRPLGAAGDRPRPAPTAVLVRPA